MKIQWAVQEELEALLNDSGHLRTLAFLYAGKGMSAKALAIWRILARNYSSSIYDKDQSVESDLQDPSRHFTSGRETAAIEGSKILEESSDQDLVLQHLGWIADINQYQASYKVSPSQCRYLQWLIEDQDSDDSQYHTAYALLLAKSALEIYEVELSTQDSVTGMPKIEMKVSELGSSSIFESPVRERFQIFLQSSDLYDAEEVLDMIEESELWLEKAILYRKLGRERLVLQILALKLENCEAAEQYCEEIGRPDAYTQLLEMYLDPEDGRDPMFKAAVRLLHNHGEMLDPLQVFKIVHNMSRALDVDASLARLEERSRHVLINEDSICDSCHARLGTKLFAMYPDDTVVCYKCYRRQGESTSVTGRDFQKDSLVKPGWLVTR
ncbi:hypothetical protein RD792_002275 [Penstemon davidsonii]|uniref:Vacuolar sorting protein 39/Transforming growth factor beta receptor-associated zinc finger domain-containing protein n=1 Tax=Penstemon davidsonii TaxID=160366 RepID=A0ABR0DQK3_9LAMI|nr:hypothetical protein RD792_002275 [Penstemon davidsonii]